MSSRARHLGLGCEHTKHRIHALDFVKTCYHLPLPTDFLAYQLQHILRPTLIRTESNHQYTLKRYHQLSNMPTFSSLLSRIFRSRKHIEENDKSTRSGSTHLSGHSTAHRARQRSKKQQDENRRNNPSSFSSDSSYYSAPRHLSEQCKHEDLVRPELECLGQICSLQDHNTPIENNPIERRNSLEQEMDDEDNFDWSSLESEVQESLAEGAASHADRTPYNLSVNRSTPFLRRKPSAKSLRRLYLESGPFRDLYLEKTPLPPAPEPLFAFPATFNTSPPDDRPTADQVDSIFDMIFDVAKRSREPSMDLGGISDILSEAGARLRREKGLRDPSKDNAPRPKSPVSPMSFGSAETLLSHESPSKGVPNPKSRVSPMSRGPPLNPFSQRRLSSRRMPRPDTPVSPFSGGAPVSSLPRGISSRERLPIPEVPVSPLSLGSAVNPFSSRPS